MVSTRKLPNPTSVVPLEEHLKAHIRPILKSELEPHLLMHVMPLIPMELRDVYVRNIQRWGKRSNDALQVGEAEEVDEDFSS